MMAWRASRPLRTVHEILDIADRFEPLERRIIELPPQPLFEKDD